MAQGMGGKLGIAAAGAALALAFGFGLGTLPSGSVSGPAVAEANHGSPSLPYVSMLRRKNAAPNRRFVLRLFTAYTHADRHRISAQKGDAHPFARFYGPNRSFHEWRIKRGTPRGGGKLIRRLRRALRSNGRVTFWGYVWTPGATGPQPAKCYLRGFNNLGGCRDVITIH